MPSWTKEQQQAIDDEGMNIIVSAGAGSGKTAVLSERALRKVMNNVDVDRMLILTFTKAAAYEMMLRIRKKIKKANLKEQVEKIDKAYITTFDSFALAIVKKYHDYLNISKDVSIIDESVISLIKRKMLDDVFMEFYQNPTETFTSLINDFCIKDDKDLKELILKLNDKLDMKYDKNDYITNYLEVFYEKEKIEADIKLFETNIFHTIKKIEEPLDKIRLMVDGDFYENLENSLKPLLSSQNYDEVLENLELKMPTLPRGSEEEVKKAKEEITNYIKEVKKICSFTSKEEIITTYLSTKNYIESILEIIKKLDKKLNEYKQEHDVYEFVDISKLAIKIVKENLEIREELKNFFNEIMIDEYQDTSDLQEEFIKLIGNDNIYMVGDVKQSIYRFRNANPYIFKEKYDKYSVLDGGKKIDLVKNFRSRKEVLDDVNRIFDIIMDNYIGGAEYSVSHRMVFGNTSYIEKGTTDQSYQTEIYNYTKEKDSEFTKDEIEAFIVADDILDKVNNHYQVFDKDEMILRDIDYSDFVILMDRSSKFDLYKKIFEYKKIPLTILKDENIMNEIEIYLVNNILKLLIQTKKQEYDEIYKYAFLSIGRSYLFEMSDNELFEIIKNKKYFETEIHSKITSILEKEPILNIEELIYTVIQEFDFYNKKIRTGNVELGTANLEYIIETASNLSKLGYHLEEFSTYLTETIESGKEIKLPAGTTSSSSVKIMTIHKSKGLEYHICYYTGLSAPFNISDLKEKILYDNTYGIITPYFKEGYGETFYKHLLKDKFYLEEISEKIRLFYVALTRCKEKMIMVADLNEETTELKDGVVEENRRLKYRSFLEILKSIYEQITDFIKEIPLETVSLSSDYKLLNSNQFLKCENNIKESLKIEEINIENEYIEKERYSKTMIDLIENKQQENIEFGKKIHSLFENIDFYHPNIKEYTNDKFLIQKVGAFLNLPILKNLENAKIYKEYEFTTEDESRHGIIDFMIEREEKIDIIDYKLKTIDDENYKRQLLGYKEYIENKTKKSTNIYLYSILDETLKQI